MKFSVSTSQLLKVLNLAQGAINTNAIIPLLEDFHLELADNELVISSSNLETSIITSIEVEGEENGAAALPAKILVDTLKALPEQIISISVDVEKNIAELKSANGYYKLASENADEYPEIPMPETEPSVEMDVDVLQSAIGKTLFATSNDELRLAMTGVLFELKSDRINFVATDAHKLVKYSFLDYQSDNAHDFIVPKKSLGILKSIISAGKKVAIGYNKSHVFFKFDKTQIACRLVDANYPNYNAVIPTNNDHQVVLDKLDLLSALKRISIYANKTTNQVMFKIKDNIMEIDAEDADFSNEASETIKCDYSGDEFQIGFNAKFLIEMLSAMESDEITMSFSSPSKAALLFPVATADDEELTMLIMPVMLKR